MKILAVMSHPDDAEVWAGGTLAKYVDCGHSAHVVVMTYGEGDDRGAEAQEGARRLGCTLELLGHRDAFFEGHGIGIRPGPGSVHQGNAADLTFP